LNIEFPKILGMAFRALTFLRAGIELAFVGIIFMTIHASIKRQLLLEITLQMALSAADLSVLSEKRVLVLEWSNSNCGSNFFHPAVV